LTLQLDGSLIEGAGVILSANKASRVSVAAVPLMISMDKG
jgi:hypothetical protein